MIKILSFQLLKAEHLELVLKWRTSPHVTQYMYTDIESNLETQKKWFERISKDNSQVFWMIYYKETAIGLISLNDIDIKNKKATSGYYIGELDYRMIAARVLPYFLNHVFLKLDFNKLVIEVMTKNESMLKMDYHYGFRTVGIFEKHIYKNNEYLDIEVLELLREKWLSDYKKYHKLIAEFE